jgi:dipeptidyl-peptidase 4
MLDHGFPCSTRPLRVLPGLFLALMLMATAPMSAQVPSAAAGEGRVPAADEGQVPVAGEGRLPAAQARLTAADYQRAEAFMSGNLDSRLFRASANPNWTEGDRFWYRTRVDGGHEFVAVNPARGTREPAFDHSRLAAALSRTIGLSYEPLRLPFSAYEEVDGGRVIRLRAEGRDWRCDLQTYACAEAEPRPESPAGVASPDGRWIAFRRDDDLWVFDRNSGEEIRLTEDGEEGYGYATDSQGWRTSELPILLWSPDSRSIATFRLDEREVEKMHLLRTAEPRPELVSWPYALPSDSIVPMVERVVVHLADRQVVALDAPADHQRTSSCCGMGRDQQWADVEWSADGEHLAFVSISRDYRTATLSVADPRTGEVRRVLSESHPAFFESRADRGVPSWRVLHESNEVLWYSQRDGWGHLFLYDLETGEVKNRVTEGSWNVLSVERVNPAEGTVLFTAVGREEALDPYYRNLYRARLDGSDLTRLTPEDQDHEVTLSPSGEFFVDQSSTVEVPPVTRLRRTRDGGEVRVLEQADAAELEGLGWQPPTSFTAKARDGVTDVSGLLIRPSNFDPGRKYPIVNAIYPGPQSGSVGTRGFTVSRRGQAHALAELGFVVVLVDAMGTPGRSKAFHTAYYGDMGDNGLPDQKAAMQELARRYGWIDLDRVGIYGHSGGGFATAAALLRHPDFFHVGVAGAGNHDNRGYTFYWGEKYHGPWKPLDGEDGTDTYANQANHLLADNLEGKLLLSYGTMDVNVHPNMTLLLIDALIAANKDFDVMVMPNRGHGFSGENYNIRRTWDYFVRHLLGAEPPREYRIGG